MSYAQLPLISVQTKGSDWHGLLKEEFPATAETAIPAVPWLPLLVPSGTSVLLWLSVPYPIGLSFIPACSAVQCVKNRNRIKIV